MVVDDLAATSSAGSDCVTACAAQFPGGVHEFLVGPGTCICDGCDDACTQSVCVEQQLPTDTCLPCVQAGFLGDCQYLGFYQACTQFTDSECYALATCIMACPTPE